MVRTLWGGCDTESESSVACVSSRGRTGETEGLHGLAHRCDSHDVDIGIDVGCLGGNHCGCKTQTRGFGQTPCRVRHLAHLTAEPDFSESDGVGFERLAAEGGQNSETETEVASGFSDSHAAHH